MKNIRIYIAAADDLKMESLEIADLVTHLNKVLNARQINLELIPHGEDMGHLHECELCLTLYHTKFGNFNKKDFENAYEDLKKNANNPQKIYVFFKDTKDISEELKIFKQGFSTNYGHFFCKFENTDTLKLHFLLQLAVYQNKYSKEDFLKVENQNILVDDLKVANLNNIPFASLNHDYVRMRDELIKLKAEITTLQDRIEKYPDNDSFKEKLLEKNDMHHKLTEMFDQHQSALLSTALRITGITEGYVTERLEKAISYFEIGKITEANAILAESERDGDIFIENYRKHKIISEKYEKSILLSIEELNLKKLSILSQDDIHIDHKVLEVKNIFEKSIDMAKKITSYKDKYAVLLIEYTKFLCEYEKYSRAIEIYEKEILIYIEKYGENIISLNESYNNIYTMCIRIGNKEKAQLYKSKIKNS